MPPILFFTGRVIGVKDCRDRNTPDPYRYQQRVWYPYISPLDPCPPQRVKTYVVAPNQFLGFQPPGLPQYPPHKALRRGTLWPILYSPYPPKKTPREER
ncbi:spore coat associated protein CotJA [Thermoactinomyces vulgaris]|jgi:spore coat protein JA|uniref:Spore coat associated protein CotJA n=1 Tax=Thermoactinomyces vulgaris TaxID=2026 RepID=A0ABS0QH05_THEVU|nr:spore coat associated protein CotJA [Thermoactinomyces vulgaris]MBA4596170.1 spore coat associated protein CotJA [Thermoactinomyces vulgaris]MBH8583097.1 spore coat associated protein CotJA [Thermoactinomyces sp. CICC 10735]MBH8588547.1 spore coat associated protein CotJA [Thermoactinomyces vulgaris]QBK13558.1 spore coat associated protein CotJA [Thermoactinomyces vulgaris]